MPAFAAWLARALADGESVQDAPPRPDAGDNSSADNVLRDHFGRLALDLAGPPPPYDGAAALAAARLLAEACWRLASGESGGPLPDIPGAGPGADFSADVCLRLLPAAYRRARLRDPEGELVAGLERLFRARPLSGVLADLGGAPAAPLDFGGHAGLQLLYAERLLRASHPGWVPPGGPARERAEAVFAAAGRTLPAPPTPPEEAGAP